MFNSSRGTLGQTQNHLLAQNVASSLQEFCEYRDRALLGYLASYLDLLGKGIDVQKRLASDYTL